MKRFIQFLFGLWLIGTTEAFAQTKTSPTTNVSGVITDLNNIPLVGVLIAVQETRTQVSTDTQGRFVIKASPGDVLVISKNGYLGQTKIVSDITDFKASLNPALTDAGDDDLVPIPFGIRKKRELNMAISTYSTRNLPQIPVASANATFAGRIPGLYVQQTGTAPGLDGAFFQTRGLSTFGPNSLRTLVDGVTRPLNDVDINEIESITVLKDAASLAWYGLRFGSGVMLITTKKGSATRNNIHFDMQTGVQSPEKMIKPLNSYDFAKLYDEALMNDGSQPIYNEATLSAYQNGSDAFRFPSNNYIESFLKQQSPSQRYVLSTDGGSNNVRYFALLGYFTQDGLFKNAKTDDYNANIGYNRFNFRGNVDFDVNKNLTIGLNVSGRSEGQRQPGNLEVGTLLSSLYNTPPNAFPIQNQDGSYGGTALFQNNPMGLLRDRGYTSFVTRVLMATIDLREKLDFWVSGLSANINYSYDVQGTYSSGLNRDFQVVDASGATPLIYRNQTPLAYRSAGFGATAQRNEGWAGFDYDRRFGKHQINASARAQRNVAYSPSQLDFRGQGLATRLDYGYNDRYYLGFVGGYSGSENFPPGKRYGFFPAVSGGWVVSDESFIKPNKFLSYMKLRASYGKVGSSDIGGSRFPFEQFFARNTGGGGYTFGTGFSATTSANEVSISNPNITWETLTSLNIGTDFHLFNHALTGSVDYFVNNRSGILTPSAIPSILGRTLVVNEGEVTSKGFDFALNYEKKIGQVSLSLYGNATIADDRIISENGQAGLPDYQSTVGRVIGSRLVFVSDGIFQNQAQIDNSPRQVLSGRVVPGDIKYKDIGGINGIPDGVIDNLDRVRVDDRDRPKAFFGFGSVIRYGIFDLSAHFQGVGGRVIDTQGIVNSGPSNFNQESLNRWTPATANTAIYPRLGISDRANNTSASDFWLTSGDFVRLKNLELGATVPKGLLSKYALKNTRLYVGGFNLFVFDKLKLDIDPEIPGAGRGSAYPYVKTIYAGFRASF
jgi:TonB-linked SusC/RagA family outer membrane protein